MDIQIGSHHLGKDHPTFFIADISANHDGDLERAKFLIRLAKDLALMLQSSKIFGLLRLSQILVLGTWEPR